MANMATQKPASAVEPSVVSMPNVNEMVINMMTKTLVKLRLGIPHWEQSPKRDNQQANAQATTEADPSI